MKNKYKFKCKICGKHMVKNGKDRLGKQRYKCTKCNKTRLVKNINKTKQNQLKKFINWIIDSTKIEHISEQSRMTFYRQTSWCWAVEPKIKVPKLSSDFIFVDATYLDKNTSLLVARDIKNVLGFRWAESENFYDYYELFKTIPEPKFVISDGHRGIVKAAETLWKNVEFQRCLVHISRDTDRKLGKRSPCHVNQIFRCHIKKLTDVKTREQADFWIEKWGNFYETHQSFIEEKRYRLDEFGKPTKKFDRVHKNLFSMTNSMKKLLDKNMIFMHIENNIPHNSNALEGGINSPLKNLVRCHRGISLQHQKRMLEWYLLKRSGTPINEFLKWLVFD